MAWCDPGTAQRHHGREGERCERSRGSRGDRRRLGLSAVVKAVTTAPLGVHSPPARGRGRRVEWVKQFRELGFETQMRHHHHCGRRCLTVVPATVPSRSHRDQGHTKQQRKRVRSSVAKGRGASGLQTPMGGATKAGEPAAFGSVPAATRSSIKEGLKWWVFSPPKLILLSKLIFKQNDVACLVRVARFVRNGK